MMMEYMKDKLKTKKEMGKEYIIIKMSLDLKKNLKMII